MNKPNIGLSRLPVGSIMPPFTLRTSDDKELSTWDMKGSRNMVVFIFGKICDEDCKDLLSDVKIKYRELVSVGAEVLAIFRMTREMADDLRFELHLPFPVLVDVDGMISSRLTYRVPALIVTDRYGEIVSEYFEGDVLKVKLEKLIARVELNELACPE